MLMGWRLMKAEFHQMLVGNLPSVELSEDGRCRHALDLVLLAVAAHVEIESKG